MNIRGRKYLILFFLLTLPVCLSSCAGRSAYYHYTRPDTGINQFVRDHSYCLKQADYFPFDIPNPMSTGAKPSKPADWDGMWVAFSPYPGAPVVNMGANGNSSTIVHSIYIPCMMVKGYDLQ